MQELARKEAQVERAAAAAAHERARAERMMAAERHALDIGRRRAGAPPMPSGSSTWRASASGACELELRGEAERVGALEQAVRRAVDQAPQRTRVLTEAIDGNGGAASRRRRIGADRSRGRTRDRCASRAAHRRRRRLSPALGGKPLGELVPGAPADVKIAGTLDAALRRRRVEAMALTTSSRFDGVIARSRDRDPAARARGVDVRGDGGAVVDAASWARLDERARARRRDPARHRRQPRLRHGSAGRCSWPAPACRVAQRAGRARRRRGQAARAVAQEGRRGADAPRSFAPACATQTHRARRAARVGAC